MPDRMNDETWSMRLAFDLDSQDFALGVEVGRLYQQLSDGERPSRALVHGLNAEMMLRLAETFGVSVKAEELGQDWLEVTFA